MRQKSTTQMSWWMSTLWLTNWKFCIQKWGEGNSYENQSRRVMQTYVNLFKKQRVKSEKCWHLHVVSMTETVSLSDSSSNMAVSRTSYLVEGLRPSTVYLFSLPLKITYDKKNRHSNIKVHFHQYKTFNLALLLNKIV